MINQTLLKFLIWTVMLNVVLSYLYPIAIRLWLLGDPPAPGAALWPKPFKFSSTNDHFFLNKYTFKFSVSNEKSNQCERDILKQMTSRYVNILFPPKLDYTIPLSSDKQLNSLIIEIENSILNPKNCKKDYYPFITDTEQEKCKYIMKFLFVLNI